MKNKGVRLVLEMDGDRLFALEAVVDGANVGVRRWVSMTRPSTVDPANAVAMGEWITSVLAEAGLQKGPLVMAIRRGEVILKRLVLPAGADMDEGDLGGMVRLQMAKQLAVAMEGSAIDYVRLGREGGTESSGVAVLAGALPGDRSRWIREVSESMGRKIARIGLRAAGAAAMLSDASRIRNGPVMGLSPGWESSEFVIVHDGRLVFARAVDIGLPRDGSDASRINEFADRLAIEAKRTWMSYRVAPESGEVEAVATVGRGPIAELISRRCAVALEIPERDAQTCESPHHVVEYPDDMPEMDRLVAAPLAALLVEAALTAPTFDFAHPRKAPDRMAAKRQMAMVAILGAILIFGSLRVVASIQLGRVGAELTAARETLGRLDGQYREFLTEDARLKHLRAWGEPDIDWLAHLTRLNEQAPDPRDALLDDVQGSMSPWVSFTPKDRRYTTGTWSSGQTARLSLSGTVKDRGVADAFRGRLVDGAEYRVLTRGADEPSRFSFDLHTDRPAPANTDNPQGQSTPATGEGQP